MATILAAANMAGRAGEILIAGSLLVVFFLALGLALWYYRRRRGESDVPSSAPWTLDDLRKLRDQGQLNETEYLTLRNTVIGLYTRESHAQSASTPNLPGEPQAEEKWDWISEDDPESGRFDIKK